MSIKVDERALENLINVVEGLDRKIQIRERDYREEEAKRQADQKLQERVSLVERENVALKAWRDSLEAIDLQKRKEELDSFEAETKKKRKEIEDLAYNKGYVAGYVEITQKLGKAS